MVGYGKGLAAEQEREFQHRIDAALKYRTRQHRIAQGTPRVPAPVIDADGVDLPAAKPPDR